MADSALQVRRYSDANEFFRAAEPVLVAREAENCLPLGIATTLLTHPERYAEPPYLATIEDGGQVVGVAMRTPPHNLMLAAVSEDDGGPDERAALDVLVKDARALYGAALPGVVGPADRAKDFAETWSATLGVTPHVTMSERIYRLDTVQPPAGVPGQMRHVEERDRVLLGQWYLAFHAEAESQEPPPDPRRVADWALSAPVGVHGVYLWEVDGQPVSLAGYGGPTPHGMRIGPVYTPPELRGHGYASAVTAGVSQFLLDMGKRFTFLYTDLSNPTSNKIYQQIGYKPVIDVLMYAFA